MVHLQEASVSQPRLRPFVEGFGLLRLSSPSIHEKEILPWPGCFLLFADAGFGLDGRNYRFACLRGIHTAASRLRWRGDDLEVFTVRFAPYGLRPFLRVPVGQLADSDSATRWSWNAPAPSLYETVATAPSLEDRVATVQAFLVEALDAGAVDAIDREIMLLADAIRTNPSDDYVPLRARIPLGSRQFARRFSTLTGINLRTYVRICRFAHAKTGMLRSPKDSLTERGYAAGYFDQAHFCREFSRLAERSPKDFPGRYPLHRIIAQRRD